MPLTPGHVPSVRGRAISSRADRAQAGADGTAEAAETEVDADATGAGDGSSPSDERPTAVPASAISAAAAPSQSPRRGGRSSAIGRNLRAIGVVCPILAAGAPGRG